MTASKCTPTALAEFVFRETWGGKKKEYERPRMTLRGMQDLHEQNVELDRWFHSFLGETINWANQCIGCSSDWKLYYEDLAGEETKMFEASRLRLLPTERSPEGTSFWCRPDLVLAGEQNEILIVERKWSRRETPNPVPRWGWPNNMTQLWCYSWIDEWGDLHRSKVKLVLEYYGSHYYSKENRLLKPVLMARKVFDGCPGWLEQNSRSWLAKFGAYFDPF